MLIGFGQLADVRINHPLDQLLNAGPGREPGRWRARLGSPTSLIAATRYLILAGERSSGSDGAFVIEQEDAIIARF
jgi:hypothetical protein